MAQGNRRDEKTEIGQRRMGQEKNGFWKYR